MTIRSNDTDFSYKLTESILSQTPSSTPSSDRFPSTQRLVSPLPPNSIVVQPQDANQSFNQYIGTHFKDDAPVLLSRIKEEDIAEKTLQEEPKMDPYPTYYSSEKKIHYFDEESSIFTVPTHFFSFGAFLFLFGFICPPLWWIGSFYPFRLNTNRFDGDVKMKHRWRLLNRFFSLGFSTLVIIAIIVLAIIYCKT